MICRGMGYKEHLLQGGCNKKGQTDAANTIAHRPHMFNLSRCARCYQRIKNDMCSRRDKKPRQDDPHNNRPSRRTNRPHPGGPHNPNTDT